jgi:hypothetical protein
MNIYATPFEQVSTIIEMINNAKSQSTHTNCVFFIIGDFNIDIRLNTIRSKTLSQYMETQNFHEITTKIHPQSRTIIDHIWTNLPISQCEINLSNAYWSDHDIIYAMLDISSSSNDGASMYMLHSPLLF